MIFFLTGTGNSLHAARCLASTLGDGDLRSIPHELWRMRAQSETAERFLYAAEAIGIVCPVYGHDLPPFVRRFIEQARFSAAYTFCVLTYGNRHGGAAQRAVGFCRENGLHLDYAASVCMADNWLPGYDAAVEAAADKGAVQRIASIAADVRARRRFVEPTSSVDAAVFERGREEHGDLFANVGFLRDFLWVSEACDGCGICTRVCPGGCFSVEGARTMSDVIAGDSCMPDAVAGIASGGAGSHAVRDASAGLGCAACLACAHACPRHAVRTNPPEKNPHARFRNAHVALSDIIGANEAPPRVGGNPHSAPGFCPGD